MKGAHHTIMHKLELCLKQCDAVHPVLYQDGLECSDSFVRFKQHCLLLCFIANDTLLKYVH